ncbi:transcription repressor OFP13-like [Lolium rigidum]|uniref:transcription repressor OFP13-like n=1 Tax=Lolium rigidum TaxID=89674 RepID=UPI001F5C6F96|nr:transcription repressor OFP13-like [Lolium rigidum]
MVSKLVLASLFFSGNVDAAASLSSPYSPPPSMSGASSSTATSWQWPSCTQARTTSFGRADDEVSSTRRGCKTRVITNPAYCDDHSAEHSFLSAADSSTSTTAPVVASEVIIRGIRASSRLFFEPVATSSIVKPAAAAFGGATAMAIDSADPYDDFRRSMEEMVLSHGADGEDDWGWLEEMLGWYLRANGKNTHGLIVAAFVDLLVAITSGRQAEPAGLVP